MDKPFAKERIYKVTKGGRLSMRDLDVKRGHISLHDVRYGGESALDMDLTSGEARGVAEALLGVNFIDYIESIVRLALDFAEDGRIATYDGTVKSSNEEIRRFAEWISDHQPSFYDRRWDMPSEPSSEDVKR